jgi:predicted ATPase
MSKQSEILQFRKEQLRQQINQALELLQGSLHKNPSQRGYHLTVKVDQKTVTKYVRKDLVPLVRAMTGNHLKVRNLLQRLSETNWRLLQLPPPD